MTREEIIEKADALVYDLRSGGRGQNGDEYRAEVEMLALVRATLKEAALAVCYWCRINKPIDRGAYVWMHDDNDCSASEIHDLIAALDKEASHE